LTFSDPTLVAQYCKIVQGPVPLPTLGPLFSVDELRRHEQFGTPLERDPHIVKLFEGLNSRHEAAMERQRKAWRALESDFRTRVASGEVLLDGLQCAPTLATSRSPIPALWARLLVFCFAQNKIATTVQNVEFIDVMGYRAGRQISAGTTPAVQPNIPSKAVTVSAPRPRGRMSYEPLIEADLRANWDEIRRRAANRPGQLPVWSELARAMHKRLDRARRNGGGAIPHVQTIRTHLPQIYARLLSENPVRK
jgi:hypothetical protein